MRAQQSTSTTARRRWWISLVALTILLSACGDGRSVEAFCSTLEEETERLNQKYSDRADQVEDQEGLLGAVIGIASLFEAQGDLVVLFERLERTAPEEIAPDVAAMRDAMKKQADAAGSGDPLQMLFEGVVTALQTGGSAERIDSYVQQNCSAG